MNVYQIITEQILKQLEAGVVPWRKPWRAALPQNFISKKEYRGINLILLNSLGFDCPYFLTFKQAKSLGGFIRKGEKGFPIVYWQMIEKGEAGDKAVFPLLRYYIVFNVTQTDGIVIPKAECRKVKSIEECERIVAGMPNPPKIKYGGDTAYYSPKLDLVSVPSRSRFANAEEFYSTIFHELTHSTSHPTRLNRKESTEALHFGDKNYSKEELVAELGASFLNAKSGISAPTLPNSAAYIAHWLAVLRNDNRIVISAARQAQKAADYVLSVEFESSGK